MRAGIDRRAMLMAGGAVLALAGGARGAAAAATRIDPARARIEPVVDDYYGTKVTDNYRWMENPKDPDWLPFLNAQNDRTRAMLDAIPGRARMAKAIAALSGDAASTRRVAPAGPWLFYEQRPAGADNYKLLARGADGVVRTLIDPTAMKAGGVYCNANVRGGGDYGRQWHLAGKKATKPNTWRDLISVCETLIADKVTNPGQLAITGTSAGGITVGRAMTERPELFAAVVSNVGWTNPIRYSAEQNVSDIEEWGPITDAQSFEIMYAMNAYQAIRPGTPYPAVLAITGATDPRVAPWHVA